jgi:DNA-binding MarR family transcriptional regulator
VHEIRVLGQVLGKGYCLVLAVTALGRLCGDRRTALMSSDTTLSDSGQLAMAPVETAVAVLRKACEKAIDELGGAVPGAQLRALLVIDDAGGSLDLSRLAAGLAASVSATGRVCDRMRAAGLLVTKGAASGQGSPCPVLTSSGRRLADWIRDRQRAALSEVLNAMRPQARQTLMQGLTELAATHQPSS